MTRALALTAVLALLAAVPASAKRSYLPVAKARHAIADRITSETDAFGAQAASVAECRRHSAVVVTCAVWFFGVDQDDGPRWDLDTRAVARLRHGRVIVKLPLVDQ
jgi:hypothetical protein